MSGIYKAGCDAFDDLAKFLSFSTVSPSKCVIKIEFPHHQARDEFVDALRIDSPPIGDWGGVSSAQAGNYEGKWMGISYELTVKS